MQTLEQSYKRAAEHYRLAYLLTGEEAASGEVTLAALGLPDDTNSFFSTWMLDWSRRIVIAKALAAIRVDLAASARGIASTRVEDAVLPPRTWALRDGTTPVQLERALLAIDVFPRCALLLAYFEAVPLPDAAILLDSAPELVRKAQIIGLRDLTRNLAVVQGWKSTPSLPYVLKTEMQHV